MLLVCVVLFVVVSMCHGVVLCLLLCWHILFVCYLLFVHVLCACQVVHRVLKAGDLGASYLSTSPTSLSTVSRELISKLFAVDTYKNTTLNILNRVEAYTNGQKLLKDTSSNNGQGLPPKGGMEFQGWTSRRETG